MDDIALLRDLAPEPAVDPAEVLIARTVLIEHIERRSRAGRFGFISRLGRPKSRRAIALAGLLTFAGAAAVGAGAFKYVAEWGPIDHPATVAALDREIHETMAAIPLPPGYTYPVEALRSLAEPPGNLTIYAGVQAVELHAMCAWTGYWLDGNRTADRSQMAAAVATMERFPTWQAISDPRLADQSVRDEVNRAIDGAEHGQPAPVQLMYTGMMCDWALAR